MANLLIRNVPDGVHSELARRAALRGQSLQAFLLNELQHIAAMATLDDLFGDIERRRHDDPGEVGFATAVADLDAERAAR